MPPLTPTTYPLAVLAAAGVGVVLGFGWYELTELRAARRRARALRRARRARRAQLKQIADPQLPGGVTNANRVHNRR